MILTPMYGRTTRPRAMIWSPTSRSMLLGMANPRPRLRPLMSVFMPITLPSRLTSGPPLLPGLMEASVWMKSS